MKKIISLLIAIGVIGCEKVKLVTPEEAERREMLEAVRTHTQVMETVINNAEEIGSILEDKAEITVVDVLHAVEEIEGVESEVKAKVSAVRRELEEEENRDNLILQFNNLQFAKEESIDSIIDSIIRKKIIEKIEDKEVKNFVEMVYNGLKECENVGELIKVLERIQPSDSFQEKCLEFTKKLVEDGKHTIYNKEWWTEVLERENSKGTVGLIAAGDVIGGVAGLLFHRWRAGKWDWKAGVEGAVMGSVWTAFGRFGPKIFKIKIKR